ncbi:MAG: WbqC family protein [Candidatus Sericytochromatia bacterium]
MTAVVISQPMFFPWVGLFEQIRLADVYVHYDDVQFSKGSFVNRVQIKTAEGPRWLTVPLRDLHLGQPIREVRVDDRLDWRAAHLAMLARHYAEAPHRDEMLDLVRAVYDQPHPLLGGLAIASMESVCRFFGLADPQTFRHAADLGIGGSGSERVLDIVRALGGTTYVTGHGARRYLSHERFEAAGIRVDYMAYQRQPYPQLHGAFDPHVSILDLIANVGREGIRNIASGTRHWREFINAATP